MILNGNWSSNWFGYKSCFHYFLAGQSHFWPFEVVFVVGGLVLVVGFVVSVYYVEDYTKSEIYKI